MTELDPIEQEIIIEVEKAIANLEALIKQTEDLRDHAMLDVLALEALQDKINRLEGKTVDVDVRVRSGALTEFLGQLADAGDTSRVFEVSGGGTAVEKSLDDIALAAARATEAQNELRYAQESVGLSDVELARMSFASRDAIFQQGEAAKTKADKLRELTSVFNVLSDAEAGQIWIPREMAQAMGLASGETDKAAAAAAGADKQYRIWGTGIRVTGTALHWLLAGSMELLAVTIPAMVAVGAAAGVMAEGFTWAKDAMTATFQATEATSAMLGKTTGNVFGLKSALQQAQTAADPMVFELLGAAAQGAKNSFGDFWQRGLDVVHMLDTFAAHVDLALGPGGALGRQTQSAISSMVSDLQGLGQVLGNIGHILLSVATSMPGIAEVILHLAAAFTGFVNAIGQNQWASYLFTGVLALEELGRWGSLLFRGLTPLAAVFGNLAGKVATTASESTMLGGVFSGLAPMFERTAEKAGLAEVAMTDAADSVKGFGSAIMMPLTSGPGRILLLVAALGLAAYELSKMKDAAQQMASSIQDAINKATPAQGLVQMIQGVNQLKSAMAQAPPTITQVGTSFRYTGDSAQVANPQIKEYQQAITSVIGQEVQLLGWNGKVGNSYYTLSEAIGLASAAGVQMNQMFDKQGNLSAIATQMIKNLINGYSMMAQTGTILSNDINAINVQTLMQQTDVSKLNQAWDSFLQTVTGGTSTLGSFNSDLSTMGNVALAATSKIQAFGQQAGGTSLSVDQVAKSLRSFSGTSAQVWQNYDAALTQAGQVTNWLRTAAAAGGVTADQYKQSIKGVVSELLPYAKYSKTAVAELSALAEQAGGPATTSYQTLAKWTGNVKDAQKNLNDTVNSATQYMANLNQVATNLSTTLNSEVASALAQGAINVQGIANAARNFSNQLHTGNLNTFAFVGSVYQMVKQLQLAGQPLDSIKSVMDQLGQKAGLTKGQIQQLNTQINNLAASINGLHDKTVTVTVNQQTVGNLGSVYASQVPTGHARGGRIPGYGGGDVVPAMLEPGEAVVPKHLVPHVAPFLGAHGVPGFAKGGPVPPGGGSNQQGPLTWAGSGLTPMEIVLQEWAKHIWHTDYKKYGTNGPIPLKTMLEIFGPKKFGKTGMWRNPQYVQLITDEQADMHGYYLKDLRFWGDEKNIKDIGKSEKKQIAIWEKDIATNYGAATEAKRLAQFKTELAHYEKKLKSEKDPYWRKIYEQDIARVRKEIKEEPHYYRDKFLADIANLKKIDEARIFKDQKDMIMLLQEMGYSKGGLVPIGKYDQGGYLPTGLSLAVNNTGRPEPVGHNLGGGVTHVHMEIGGREIANAVIPDLIGAANRYTYRNSGRATGILRPI